MKKLFKNIAKSAKSAAINCQTSIAAFHRRAVCGNAGEGYIDTAVKVLIAVVLGVSTPPSWPGAPWCWPACTRS